MAQELRRLRLPGEEIVVRGGLTWADGNAGPHFSVTADVFLIQVQFGRAWRRLASGGCQHELVLQHFPELAPLVALHLSDIDGVPMHAAENGLYWLAGAAGGNALGQTFHGNNDRQGRSQEECRRIATEHFRETEEGIDALIERLRSMRSDTKSDRELIRAAVGSYVHAQRPRWKAEADAAIKQFNLIVPGVAS